MLLVEIPFHFKCKLSEITCENVLIAVCHNMALVKYEIP